MNQVSIWIERPPDPEDPDGLVQIEQHVRPLMKWKRDEATGRALVNPVTGRNVADEDYAAKVYELVKGYDGGNARDVAMDLTKEAVRSDETGALRHLALALREVGERVIRRQQRGEGLRAVWLADFELATMTVRVRAE